LFSKDRYQTCQQADVQEIRYYQRGAHSHRNGQDVGHVEQTNLRRVRGPGGIEAVNVSISLSEDDQNVSEAGSA